MLHVDDLLAPISATQPCGDDLAFSPEIDAINRARQADDPSIEQGAWVTALKEADWKFVANECTRLIAGRSKDLQLAVWLAEASAKTGRLRGLADSLFLLAELCDRYWEHLYPTLDDGVEQRIGNLCWIAARAPQLIRDVPVTEDGAFTMLRVEGATAAGPDVVAALDAARRRTSRAFHEALLSDCELCVAALDKLEQVIDVRLAGDGPSLAAARDALQALAHVLPPSMNEPARVAPTAGVAAPAFDAAVQTRAQALAQLRAVADFFRRTEPHSPVAYLADKAAHWGEQPLHVWLRAVVKDDAAFAQFEDLLGLQSQG